MRLRQGRAHQRGGRDPELMEPEDRPEAFEGEGTAFPASGVFRASTGLVARLAGCSAGNDSPHASAMIPAASGDRTLAIRLTKSMMSPFALHPKQWKRSVPRYGSILS